MTRTVEKAPLVVRVADYMIGSIAVAQLARRCSFLTKYAPDGTPSIWLTWEITRHEILPDGTVGDQLNLRPYPLELRGGNDTLLDENDNIIAVQAHDSEQGEPEAVWLARAGAMPGTNVLQGDRFAEQGGQPVVMDEEHRKHILVASHIGRCMPPKGY